MITKIDFVAPKGQKRRSRTGCFTCRRRKVRCDEHRPACGACIRLSLPCSFPPVEADRPARTSPSRRKRQHMKSTVHHHLSAPTTPLQSFLQHDQITPSSLSLPLPSEPESAAALQASTSSLDGNDGRSSGSGPCHISAAGDCQQLFSTWWSSLGEGLLDVNWLECWVPELDDQFFDGCEYGIGLPRGRDTAQMQQLQLPSTALPQLDKPAAAATAAAAAAATPSCHVTLLPEDRPYLQHFTTTMVRFCILRNCVHDNLYSYILLNMGLFHRSLFDAMMAWSALHLAHVQKESSFEARRRYDCAYTALIGDLGHGVAPSLLLATAWFLLQYQLILAESVEGFCELIDLAAEVLRGELQNSSAETAMGRIGPVGSLILVWMSARDSQAAYLGLGGRLLGCLKTYPYVYDLVDASSVSHEEGGDGTADIVFMEHKQLSSVRARPSEMQTCMKLSFQNVTVAGQIKFLGRSEMHKAAANNYIAWEKIRTNLSLLRQDIEQGATEAAQAAVGVALGNLAAMPLVEPIHYNRLLLLACYYTTLIQYHLFRPRSHARDADAELLSPEDCADRMIRLCQRVETARPNSPQGIWPTQVLIAGINTRDPIYQAWASRTFEKAERWGAHIVKARVLLDAVVRRQNATGRRANLIEVMKETTGFFIF